MHHALTERRVAGEPWLRMLQERFGAVGGASSLSLYDADLVMRLENVGKHFGVPAFQYAARELFVVDDDQQVVGHSVVNLVTIMGDDAMFNRFMDATNKSLSSPLNTDLRLAFHDMIHDFTREKPLTEPLLPKDYAA